MTCNSVDNSSDVYILHFTISKNANILPCIEAPPDQPVEDWLKWTRVDFECKHSEISPTLTALMGINKARDIQYLFMLTIIPVALMATLLL